MNMEPTLTVTAENPTFIEATGALAVNLFSGADVSTIESGQNLTSLTVEVANILNGGNSERLDFNGTSLQMTDGNEVSAGGVTATVSVIGTTATVVFTFVGGIDEAGFEAFMNALGYRNGANNPIEGDRVITITELTDDGGTAAGGDDTTALNLSSTISVVGTNDDPTFFQPTSDITVFENSPSDVDLSMGSFGDIDANGADITLELSADTGVLTGADFGGVIVTGSGTDKLVLVGTISQINAYLNNTTLIQYTGAAGISGDDAAILTLTANDGGNSGSGGGGGGDVVVATVNIDITETAIPTSGDDFIVGTVKADTIDALGGNDTIYGSTGDDIIIGGLGIDTIEGGIGNDTIIDNNNAAASNVDHNDGGDGIDTYAALGVVWAPGVTFNLLTGQQTVTSGTVRDTFTNIENLTITGDASIIGDNMDNRLESSDVLGAGDNTISGNGGDDILIGNGGNDTLNGGLGADELNGGSGSDTASYENSVAGVTVYTNGSAGRNGEAQGDVLDSIENIIGSDQQDNIVLNADTAVDNTVNAGDGDDRIRDRDDGNNTFNGEGGDDRLFGGAGDDTLNGGDGLDDLFGAEGNDTLNGGMDGLRDSLFGSSGNDILNGGGGNDALRGNTGNDTLNGGDDDDGLEGGNGIDILNGDAGNDTLEGGGGTDTLNGGTGNDRLTGGSSADLFIFETGSGTDRIVDFNFGAGDQIDVTDFGLGDFGDIQALMTQTGTDLRINFASGDTLILLDTTMADVDASDFIVV